MIFDDLDPYDKDYTYDEMKVICVLSQMPEAADLDYEDLANISGAVYDSWMDGMDPKEDWRYMEHPWLKIENREEEGYIQEYAQRVLPNFIELYMAEVWK